MANNGSSQQANVAIALGSNLGDSLATLENSLHTLNHISGINLVSCSPWYQTLPVGGPPQPDYLNGCALLAVKITPQQLLDTLLAVERKFGRLRQERDGPRTLDLDVILFDKLIINTPELTVPHPRMHSRAFVLVPLAEIAPDWFDPVTGKTIQQLLEAVDCSGVNFYKNSQFPQSVSF